MTEDTTNRREQIRREIAALERELETLPPPPMTTVEVLAAWREQFLPPTDAADARKRSAAPGTGVSYNL